MTNPQAFFASGMTSVTPEALARSSIAVMRSREPSVGRLADVSTQRATRGGGAGPRAARGGAGATPAGARSEPLFQELLQRPIASMVDLEQWLFDCSELSGAIAEERTKRYIAMTTQTDDPVREQAYQDFVEQIETKTKPIA